MLFPLMSIGGGSIGGFNFGLNSYYILLLIIAIPSTYLLLFSKIKVQRDVKKILFILFVFVMYAVLSSFINPQLFEGVDVIDPRGGIGGGYDKLSWSFSNLGQSVYLIINFLFVIYCISKVDDYDIFYKYMYRILLLSIFVSIVFTIWQFLNKWLGIYYPYDVFFNMMDRGQVTQTMSGYFRINGSMREPSDLGRLLGCFFALSLIGFYKYKKSTIYKYFSISIMLLVVLSTSSTGIIVVFLVIAGSLMLYIKKTFSSKFRINKSIILYATISLFILSFTYYQFSTAIDEIIYASAIEKTESTSFENRSQADIFSLNILVDTYFLGAGLGSNRPSSFLVYIISNTGIIGFLLSTALLYKIFKVYLKYHKNDPYLDITFAAFLTCIVAKSIAGPDLSTEYLWVFLMILLVNINLAAKYTKANVIDQYNSTVN